MKLKKSVIYDLIFLLNKYNNDYFLRKSFYNND